MQDFSASPREMVASFWRNHELIFALIKRDVVGRYKGSFIGLIWSFLNPVLMLVVYTFVFSVVFKAHWPGGGESRTHFALTLFVGLMVFNFFSECLQRSPGLLLQNPNYITKITFPLEILPIVVVGGAIFHLLISFLVWGLFYFVFIGPLNVSALYFPFILLPLIFLVLGLVYIFASLGIYMRDMSQFMGIFLAALMFLSPIFYPITVLPASYQPFLILNPIGPEIEWMRSVLLLNKPPDWYFFFLYFFGAILISLAGFLWFQKTRAGFADVL